MNKPAWVLTVRNERIPGAKSDNSKPYGGPFSLIQRNRWKFIASVVTAAIAVRLIVAASSPSFVATGDSGSWVALAREIYGNSFLIPGTNSIHYPGSLWVYPPVVPYLIAVLSTVTGSEGLTLFYAVTGLSILIGGFTVIPLYLAVEKLYGHRAAVLSAFMYPAFPPLLYLLSWSALPQIAGFLVITIILYELSTVYSGGGSLGKSALIVSFLSFVLIFIHDLGAIFYLAAGIVLSLYFLIAGHIRDSRNYHDTGLVSAAGFFSASVAFLIWYIPRLSWLSETGSISSASGTIGTLSEFVRIDLFNLSQPLSVPYPIYYLSILVIVASALFIFLYFHRRVNHGADPVIVFSVIMLLIVVIAIPFPVFFVRSSYFLSLMYLFFAPAILARYIFTGRKSTGTTTLVRSADARKVISVLVIVFIILYSSWGIMFNYSSHTYYATQDHGTPSDVISTAEWIGANVNHDAVIATYGDIGTFIMGFSGNPVIAYQNLSFLTQFAEVNESVASGVLVAHPLINVSQTLSLISEYNVSVVISSLGPGEVPGFYHFVYGEEPLYVYEINY